MEPSILFAEFILSMCAAHFVGNASEYFIEWRTKNLGHRTTSGKPVKKIVRSDWYVFFSCADLYGKEPQKKQSQVDKPDYKVTSRRDHRPILRV